MLSDGDGIISESGGDYFSELGGRDHFGIRGADCLGICRLWLWVVADNLQVGAALNALLIAQLAIANRVIGGK